MYFSTIDQNEKKTISRSTSSFNTVYTDGVFQEGLDPSSPVHHQREAVNPGNHRHSTSPTKTLGFNAFPAVPVATCVSRADNDGIVRVTTVGLKRFWQSVAMGRLSPSVPLPDLAEPLSALAQPHRPASLQRLPTIITPSLVARLLNAKHRSRVECV